LVGTDKINTANNIVQSAIKPIDDDGVLVQPGQLRLEQCMLGLQSSIPIQQSPNSHWYNPVWLHTNTNVSRAINERTENSGSYTAEGGL